MWAGRATLRTPLAAARLVVVDLETTGLRADRDRLIAIGAVGVGSRAIVLADSFERVLRQQASSATENILIHRIGTAQQLAGAEPADALQEFLEFAGEATLIAYRAPFDAQVLRRAYRSTLGITPRWQFGDLAELLPALFPATKATSLDGWAAHFKLRIQRRHHALADAFLTAQLLLIALARLEELGRHTVADLVQIERWRRWLPPR